jgi:hypothetical protein
MEPIVKTALVGTARSSEPARTGAPTDELVQQAGVEGAEKGLLLAAGAWSVWRLAGRKPDLLPELPELAPAETRPACSPRAAEVLEQVIDGPYRMLLPEAGRLLAEAGRILPPALLPSALSLPKTYRGELRQALGERGVWLARMEPAWSWVVSGDGGDAGDAGGDTEGIPADADRLWEEGSHEQREALLRRVRRVDPGRARDWLAAGFAKEKADRRAALLETFAAGLGPDDEPFLEKALDDRSQQVRAAAAPLLARLPGSAYAARLRERADAMLSWEEPAKPAGLLGKVGALLGGSGASKGKLLVEPPQEVDKSWERDGIPATPPQGVGKRAFWLTHVLSRVPPAHWERRFGKTPAELVAAARETDWQGALLEGWARAALDFGGAPWMAPLWDAGREIRKDFGPGALPELRPLRPEILAAMPAMEQEERIQLLLGEPTAEEGPLDLYLRRLAQPWKPAFAASYLQQLRAAAEAAVRGSSVASGTASAWLGTIALAAVALPAESFDAALAPWPPFNEIEKPDWFQRSWIDKLQELEDVLHLRRTLRKEIVP